ncbi:MAG: hypothetical protein U0103_18795 [Candidatus Obscuribacterales bacterium]|nr:MAG: hypothetical protein EKK48_25410 [Candidatus Melainabacteria bacterium]
MRVSLSALLILGLSFGFANVPCLAVEKVLATPGVGIGVAKLGMTAQKMKEAAGNFDGSYTLPSGVKVEHADWKDKGLTTVMLKVFYDKDGKAIQIASAGSAVVTKDGISKQSPLTSLMANRLKLTEYRAKNGRVDYYDNVSAGIAYEYRRLDEDLARKMYAIIVHKRGVPVMSDQDEVPLKKK